MEQKKILISSDLGVSLVFTEVLFEIKDIKRVRHFLSLNRSFIFPEGKNKWLGYWTKELAEQAEVDWKEVEGRDVFLLTLSERQKSVSVFVNSSLEAVLFSEWLRNKWKGFAKLQGALVWCKLWYDEDELMAVTTDLPHKFAQAVEEDESDDDSPEFVYVEFDSKQSFLWEAELTIAHYYTVEKADKPNTLFSEIADKFIQKASELEDPENGQDQA
jgi:hypothetical protein